MLGSARLSRYLTYLGHAILVCSIILGLFYNWFAVANRSNIFLYNHLGAQPFDTRTVSRYWMAGLVADGVVLIGYTLVNWFWARIRGVVLQTYRPPCWWRLWLIVALPVGIGIGYIVTTQNMPVMPVGIALKIVVVTLVGLIPALIPAKFAAETPARVIWPTLAGAGLIPALLLLRVWERVPDGDISVTMASISGLGSTFVGAVWLFGVMGWLARRRIFVSAWAILLSGICWSYLVLPVAHYLLLTPVQYRYISVSENFFAETLFWQFIAMATAAGLSFTAAHIKNRRER